MAMRGRGRMMTMNRLPPSASSLVDIPIANTMKATLSSSSLPHSSSTRISSISSSSSASSSSMLPSLFTTRPIAPSRSFSMISTSSPTQLSRDGRPTLFNAYRHHRHPPLPLPYSPRNPARFPLQFFSSSSSTPLVRHNRSSSSTYSTASITNNYQTIGSFPSATRQQGSSSRWLRNSLALVPLGLLLGSAIIIDSDSNNNSSSSSSTPTDATAETASTQSASFSFDSIGRYLTRVASLVLALPGNAVDRLKSLSTYELTTLPIMLANAAVFLVWRMHTRRTWRFMCRHFTLGRNGIRHHRYYTLLTAAFSHRGILHFACNMFVIWSFAPQVCMLVTPLQFYAGYLSAGIFASCCRLVWARLTNCSRKSLGASGAAMGLILFAAAVNPHRQLAFIFMPSAGFDAWKIIGALLLFDLFGLFRRWSIIDHAAHLGGAFAGVCLFIAGKKFGQLQNWNGVGEQELPGGGSYVGELRNGVWDGHGKITIPGTVYTGEVRDGNIEGFGIATQEGGFYVGYWKDSRKHGLGILQFADGDYIVSNFVDGNPSDLVVVYFASLDEYAVAAVQANGKFRLKAMLGNKYRSSVGTIFAPGCPFLGI